ncbi:tandem-95 repeat protein [Gallaecimonas xiamenensis]|uniref:Dystroglycan-type cadherin-like domain-containing protein n=1 Tax=Gallaecimonas xiamenensis 3-C-1 TaxID=745411 RepID=K2JST7_9GAMM|nr:Ig-like domain-containing protein [Gallaecimonas xiamenensis]EKE77577.1 hypothetical protein B3C1_02160 [Gallaecimonas xiamenensis 3-C-1]
MRQLAWLLLGWILAFNANAGTLVLADAKLASQLVLPADAELRLVNSLDDLPGALAGKAWDRVSLVSHGEPGALELGGEKLDLAYLNDNPGFLAPWRQQLAADAQLELWGCGLAAGDGHLLVDALAKGLGRPVLASTNATGPASLGGDLVLEYGKGSPVDSTLLSRLPVLLAVTNENFEGICAGGCTPARPTYDNNTQLGDSFVFYSNNSNGGIQPLQITNLNSADGISPSGTYWLYFYNQNPGEVTEARISSADGSEFKLDSLLLATGAGDATVTLRAYKNGAEVGSTSASSGVVNLSGNTAFNDIDSLHITSSDLDIYVDDITVSAAVVSGDSSGNLIGGGVPEATQIASTADSPAEAVNVLDFTLLDGGAGDGLALNVSEVRVHVSGPSTDADRSKITWRLSGPDAVFVAGSYDGATDVLTFPVSISIADGSSENYAISGYFNDNTGLTDGNRFLLSIDGDTDLTVGSSGTQMGTTSAIDNGAGLATAIDATLLAFTTQPAGSVSGSALTTQPVVRAQDDFGNTDASFTGNITLTEASAGSLSGTTTLAAINGIATFSGITYTASADQESFTLTAAGGGLTDATANSITADVVATKLLFSTEPAPISIISGALTNFSTVPVVQAVDANDTLDTGYSTDIVLSVTDPNDGVLDGSINTLSGTGDGDGNSVTVTLTPGTGSATFTNLALQYTNTGPSESLALRASSGGLTSATSTTITSLAGPRVTDANISVSGGSGIGGAYKIGDTVTAQWDNSGTGDNNSGVTAVTVDFSQFGGGSSVAASNSGDIWTATYLLPAGSIDAVSRNVSVSAANGSGTTTTADTSNATVDNQAPVVTDGRISIGGASGSGGTFIVGDTITATWDNTASGDNNSDGLSAVTVDFSQFGGSSVAASNSGNTWTATYTLVAGSVEGSNLNVTVTVTDNAGNSVLAVDSSNASVDNQPPVAPSAPVLAAGSDSGTPGDGITKDNTPTLTGTAAASATVRVKNTGGTVGTTTSDAGGNWSLTTSTLADGSQSLTAVQLDSSGNESAPSPALALTIDSTAPGGYSLVADQSPINAANQGAASVTLSGAEVGAQYQLTVSSSGGGSPVLASGAVSAANQQITGLGLSGLADGTLTYSLTLTDEAGNSGTAASDTVIKDSTPPTGYSASFGAGFVNIANQAAQSVTISGGEIGASYQLSISNGADNISRSGTLTGTSLTLNSLDLSSFADGTLSLTLVLTDTAGNAGTAATVSITKDTVAPTLQSSAPADGATDVALGVAPSLSFNEAVAAGASGDNGLALTASDSTVVFSGAANGGDVEVSGSTLTLNLTNSLVPDLVHELTLGAEAVTDLAGNPFAGGTVLSFTARNADPQALADSYSLTEDQAKQLPVLANDTVVRGRLNGASLTISTAPSHGSLSLNTGTGVLTYSPDPDYNGADSFAYQVQDTFGVLSNIATVTLAIAAVNDAPRALDDAASLAGGASLLVDVLANDLEVDSGDSLDPDSLVISSGPLQGQASVEAGQIRYQAPSGWQGQVSLQYRVADTQGVLSNDAILTLQVLDGAAPLAVADAASLDEDTPTLVDILANDSGSGLVPVVVQGPVHGTLALSSNQFLYTPDADYNGADSFLYRVEDDQGLTSAAATVSLTVNPVNDAPVAQPDTVVLSGSDALDINVLGNDSDVDNALADLTIQFTGAPASGGISFNGRLVRYQPSGSPVSDSFQYRLQDSLGAWSAPVTVNLVAAAPNQPPLANSDLAQTNQDQPIAIGVLLNDSDLDGSLDSDSIVVVQNPEHGTATPGTAIITYTPAAGFYGVDRLRYQVMDDQGDLSNPAWVDIQVRKVGQVPVAQADSLTLAMNTNAELDLLANDSDGDGAVVAIDIRQAPAQGALQLLGAGRVRYTPNTDFVGQDSLRYVALDNDGLASNEVALTIEVFNPNSAPQISGSPATQVAQGASYQFQPQASDADGDSLMFSIQNKPGWASFDTATGSLSGVPGNADVGNYSAIQISVSDGQAQASLPAFSIQVLNVNDAPVAGNLGFNLDEGGLLVVAAAQGVLSVASDPDNDSLTVTLLAGPAHASAFNLAADGSFSYQHDGSEGTSDSFQYRLSDGQGGETQGQVTFTLAPVNDAPRFTSQAPLTLAVGASLAYQVEVEDPDSSVSLSLTQAPSWLTLSGNLLAGTAPLDALGDHNISLVASDGQLQATQSFVLTVTEADTAMVSLSRRWVGLPARVGKPLRLMISAQHEMGPALADASLVIRLQGGSMSALAGCSLSGDTQRCPLNLAVDAQAQWTLPVSTANQGDQLVHLELQDSEGALLASLNTDVTITADTLTQGDRAAVIAKASALALLQDGDQPYLVVGTTAGEGVTLYRIEGNSLVAEAAIDNLGDARDLAVLDWNQDGLEDLVVINASGDASTLYLNQGDLHFNALQTLAYGHKVRVAELNGDDYPDLLVGAPALTFYGGNDGGTVALPLAQSTPFSLSDFALWPDGRILVSNGQRLQLVNLSLLLAKAGAQASPAAAEPEPLLPGEIRTLRVADFDGDGQVEVAVSYGPDQQGSGGGVALVVAQGDDFVVDSQVGEAAVQDLLVADFDGDGDLDLLTQHDNGAWQLLRNEGSTWTALSQSLFHPDSLGLVADLNGDGLADILLANTEDGSLVIYDGKAILEQLGPQADMALSATLEPSGQDYQSQYQLKVQNLGPASSNDNLLVLSLPASLVVSGMPASCVQDADLWLCPLGSLASGAEQRLTLTLTAQPNLANSLLLARVYGSASDLNSANNQVEFKVSDGWAPYWVENRSHGGSLGSGALVLLAWLGWRRRRH